MTKNSHNDRLRKIVESFPNVTITVLGDLVADEFVFGEISRVSREAPVLILKHRDRSIVPGGGVAYIRAIESLEKLKGDNEDETTGVAIVKRALEEPIRQIVANSGIEGSIVVQKVKEGKGDFGFNAKEEEYENLYKAGVIDPTKVTRIALENAASIAGMLLTTECVVADKPKKEEPHMHPGGAPGMGGMDY